MSPAALITSLTLTRSPCSRNRREETCSIAAWFLAVWTLDARGIATPADASLVMQLGAESVFVGSGIFMQDSTTCANPEEAAKRARAIVQAVTHYNDPKVLLEVSEDLVGAMKGLAVAGLDEAHMLQTRGW